MDDTFLAVEHVDGDPVADRRLEFVERKGPGHPDSLCDGVAEAVSRALSRTYRERFGRILHHNTDKVTLVAGRSRASFGDGELLERPYLLVAGRATREWDGEPVPVDGVAERAAREYLDGTVAALDRDDVAVDVRLGEASPDLTGIFDGDGVPRANDTSVGVGHAPLSPTERAVREAEPRVRAVDAVGEDVKVMGLRAGDELRLTVAAATVADRVPDREAYRAVVEEVRTVAREAAEATTDRDVAVEVNAADDVDGDSVYLTATGTSAEMGDDGAVGRGNRANGLITPHRPTSLEAVAGKNPVSHVGKLYNLLAREAARHVHEETGGFAGVQLLSRIGAPITEPQAVDVTASGGDEAAVLAVVEAELRDVTALTDRVVAGEVETF